MGLKKADNEGGWEMNTLLDIRYKRRAQEKPDSKHRELTGAAAVGAVVVLPVKGLEKRLEASFLPLKVLKRLEMKVLPSCCCLITWSLISICSGAAACTDKANMGLSRSTLEHWMTSYHSGHASTFRPTSSSDK